MTTVWKFKLLPDRDGKTKIDVPHGPFRPLHVDAQPDLYGNGYYLWAEVNGSNGDPAKHEIHLQMIGTGWEVPESGEYLGTIMDGAFVWHVYRVWAWKRDGVQASGPTAMPA